MSDAFILVLEIYGVVIKCFLGIGKSRFLLVLPIFRIQIFIREWGDVNRDAVLIFDLAFLAALYGPYAARSDRQERALLIGEGIIDARLEIARIGVGVWVEVVFRRHVAILADGEDELRGCRRRWRRNR
jgi:hypothetical protein